MLQNLVQLLNLLMAHLRYVGQRLAEPLQFLYIHLHSISEVVASTANGC